MNNGSRQWAPLALRIVLGAGFIYHGWPKLFSVVGHEQFAGTLVSLGIPGAQLMSWVVAVVEVVGGLALLLGAWTQWVAIPLIVEILVALFTVHLSQGFSFIHVIGMENGQPVYGLPGWEVDLLYLGGLITLLLGGAGALSVDSARLHGGRVLAEG
jgi:putative oxidoreductase